MQRSIILLVCILTTALFFQCGTANLAGGTDTESSGGRLTGLVLSSNNVTTANTQIRLVPENHTPLTNDTIRYALANDSGKYYFTEVDTGIYNLEAVHPINGTRLLVRGIHIDEGIETTMAPETLQIPGSIIIFYDSLSTISNSLFYIPGTTIQNQNQTTTDSIRIDSIPAGIVTPIYATVSAGKPAAITDTLHLNPSETLKVSVFNDWKYAAKIYLNTSTVTSDKLTGFPFLIRLDNTNFDFSQATTNGKDLRFTRNFKQLPYEIERWDSTEATAAIWVLLDTLDNADLSQTINMYWGNSNAKKISNGATVFDTARDYCTVLHIGQESSGIQNEDLYIDATPAGNNGDDMIADSKRDGIIGYGKHFDSGEEDYILIDTLKLCSIGTGPFTFSLWFKPDYNQQTTLFAAYFVDTDTITFAVTMDTNGSVYAISGTDTLLTGSLSASTAWTHLVLTRSVTGLLSMYIDGSLIRSTVFTTSLQSQSFAFIGSDITSSPGFDHINLSFMGNIDEFRIETIERSPAYIKMCYTNQQLSSAILLSQ